MTKDEQRDIVLNFFKERGHELKKIKAIRNNYDFHDEKIIILLWNNDYGGLGITKEVKPKDMQEIGVINYYILNLPTDQKELTVLLNILNPQPV